MSSGCTRRQWLAGAAGLWWAWPGWGVDWNQSQAFSSFYNLDYDTAIEALERESRNNPDDPGAFNHLAYGLLYRTLFRSDALDGAIALSPSKFLGKPKVAMESGDKARFDLALERSKNISWDRLKKNPGQPEALYTLGVAELHKANYLFLIEKQWRAALKQASEARRLHIEAFAKDGQLIDALLVPTVHEYVLGSLPALLKAIGFLVGLRGDRQKGAEGVRRVAQQGKRTRVEARVLLALIEQREQRPGQALEVMRGLCQEFPSNHLYRMELVNLCAATRRYSEGEAEMKMLDEPRYRFLSAARKERFRKEWAEKRKV